MNHGNYEIVFKAGKGNVSDWSKYQEKIIVIEADSKGDAENIAKKQIKTMGFSSYKIIAVKFLKQTINNNINNHENEKISAREEWKNKTPAEKKAYVFWNIIIIGILVAIVLFALKN